MRPIAHPVRACLLFAVVAIVLAFGLRSLAANRAEAAAPGFGAEWIWARGVADADAPTAFRLVRDLRIEPGDGDSSDPDGPADALTLDLAVDGTYELWIDGLRVGSGAWGSAGAEANRRDAEKLHRYVLDDFLGPGLHRIELEVRSEHGVGGVLAVMRRGSEILLRSDASWRVVRHRLPGIREGTLDLASESAPLEAPRVWGPPPAGRWRVAAEPQRVADVAPGWPIETHARPIRVRHPTDGSDWMPLGELLPELDAQSIFDFGRPVTGFLELGLPCDPTAPEGEPIDEERPPEIPTALLHTSLESPESVASVDARPAAPSTEEVSLLDRVWPRDRRPDGVLLAVPGACTWRDAVLRTVRYVSIAGVTPRDGLRMIEVEPARSEAVAVGRRPAPRERRGAFGLPPARGWSPIEERVWDRLGDAAGN